MGRLIDADALSELVKEPIDVFLSRLDLKCPPIIDLEPHWIPVSERLPKKEGYFFVTDEAAGMAETLIDKYIRCDDGEWVWLYSQHVVAWMPLPEPYKPYKEVDA